MEQERKMVDKDDVLILGEDEPAGLDFLIDRGQVQGYLTHSDILDIIPEADADTQAFERVLERITEAGIPYTDLNDLDLWPSEVVDFSTQQAAEDEKDTAAPEWAGEETAGEGQFLKELDQEIDTDDLAGVDTDDMVRLYVREAARVPLLTVEEEVDLAKRIERCVRAQKELESGKVSSERMLELRNYIRDGKRARERLVRANARLVISVARKYINRGVPFLDLIQEGNIGLMRAVRNFDYTRGFKFSTYATWWIRQAVTRALAEQSRTIRLPVHMSDAVNRMLRAQTSLQQQLGRRPTTPELAEALEVPPAKVEQMLDVVRQPLSLQAPVGDDEEMMLGDFIEDEAAPDPEEAAVASLMNDDLKKRLEILPERELELLQMRYGLGGREPMTLNEVGKQLGITRERARQLEAQALERLRNPTKRKRRRGSSNQN